MPCYVADANFSMVSRNTRVTRDAPTSPLSDWRRAAIGEYECRYFLIVRSLASKVKECRAAGGPKAAGLAEILDEAGLIHQVCSSNTTTRRSDNNLCSMICRIRIEA